MILFNLKFNILDKEIICVRFFLIVLINFLFLNVMYNIRKNPFTLLINMKLIRYYKNKA